MSGVASVHRCRGNGSSVLWAESAREGNQSGSVEKEDPLQERGIRAGRRLHLKRLVPSGGKVTVATIQWVSFGCVELRGAWGSATESCLLKEQFELSGGYSRVAGRFR